MRYLDVIALLLVIVGGINWLLVGLAELDLVATLTGSQFGEVNLVSRVIYILVGVAAIWLLRTLARWAMALSDGTTAQRS